MPNFDAILEQSADTRTMKKHPDMYHVIFYNDDFTAMEFVVAVLNDVFQMSVEQAFMVMLAIHTQGKGIVGTYTREEAYRRVELVDAMKAEYNQPLIVNVEKVQ
jgi:ATP-dependent Clp protease adaptor protein ClpS